MDIPTLDILKVEQAAQAFAALGSEQRLSVLVALVAAGPEGMAAGALAERVGLGASTLTHHLRFLAQAGLVTQERQGRRIISKANYARVRQISDYLLLTCCADVDAPSKEHAHD
ncbi:ArsR/SmtB family transcription factor [Oceanibium sediminis]|uniref:ArsR/SmtB family transcription factor n=1 Tax=Oceanibium sediminis TaxID=2026339 RepID=UPI000DD38D21|nr:metalloregulator ArsR/SmtB family transcription factor [Oceanibium sediminis]